MGKARKSGMSITSTVFSLAIPLSMCAIYFADQPFSRVLSTRTISLIALSQQQKLNIENASSRLNGIVIKPHEEFSFNGAVGPRNTRRGYLPAPSYVDKGSPQTIGGGICLVSSALYEDALETGFDITARKPHTRAIHSVAPGLDATVWYGGSDLAFRNNLDSPVEIISHYSPDAFTIEIRGDAIMCNWQRAKISRDEQHQPGGKISVNVHSTQHGHTKLISHDVYDIPTFGEHRR